MGFHASVNPRFNARILDFMEGIQDFIENFMIKFNAFQSGT